MNDMQLFLLVPFQVIVLKKWRALGIGMNICLILVNIALSAIMVIEYDLKSGLLAIQNVDVYHSLITKPYMHLAPHTIGVFFAFIYERTKEF